MRKRPADCPPASAAPAAGRAGPAGVGGEGPRLVPGDPPQRRDGAGWESTGLLRAGPLRGR